MASEDANIRPPSTPHRIRIPSAEDNTKDSEKRLIIGTDKTIHHVDSRVGAAIQTPDKPMTKTYVKRGRKPVNRSIADQKVTINNHKVTEYFQARRSVRKCKKAVLEEMQRDLESKVLQRVEDGLQV